MNLLEEKMIEVLKELKEKYQVVGVKAEFEAEGSTFDEIELLKNIASQVGLELAVKIGGCESVRDLRDIKKIGANTIVAPMIETSYAMKKFVNALTTVFTKEERENINFFINIETITGFTNLEDIISTDELNEISGIILGRTDLAGSLGLAKTEVNSLQILNIAQIMSKKLQSLNKDFIIGGNITVESIPFFEKINYINGFETRKVVFNKTTDFYSISTGINKAIEFEILWLKNKFDYFGTRFDEDLLRVKMLEANYQKYNV